MIRRKKDRSGGFKYAINAQIDHLRVRIDAVCERGSGIGGGIKHFECLRCIHRIQP
jgi:hypothetical protein